MSELEQRIARLEDLEAIRDLDARYCRGARRPRLGLAWPGSNRHEGVSFRPSLAQLATTAASPTGGQRRPAHVRELGWVDRRASDLTSSSVGGVDNASMP